MKNILIVTPIDCVKTKLMGLLKRRNIVFDYLKLFDYELLNSVSRDDRLSYIGQKISEKKIDTVIWLPATSSAHNFRHSEILSFCFQNENVFSITFNILKFISSEAGKLIVYKNEISQGDELIKGTCRNVYKIGSVLDFNISALSDEIKLTSDQTLTCDSKIPLSLIDDIASFIFTEDSEVEVPSQTYTISQIDQSINRAFDLIDAGEKITIAQSKSDRVETYIRQNACCLKPIYQLEANELWREKRIVSIRMAMGAKLAQQIEPVEKDSIDIIVPVPESGKYYAQGLAEKLGKPLVEAIVRDQSMGRGLQIENPAQRNIFIRKRRKLTRIKLKGVKKNDARNEFSTSKTNDEKNGYCSTRN